MRIAACAKHLPCDVLRPEPRTMNAEDAKPRRRKRNETSPSPTVESLQPLFLETKDM